MGHYVQYSIDLRLSLEIPDDYIQALLFFAGEDNKFTGFNDIKKAFPSWREYVELWGWLVNCNTYFIETDYNYKEKLFSLVKSTEFYHFIMLSQCDETEAYNSLLEWIKPYILRGNKPDIGYHMGLTPDYDKCVVIYDGEKFQDVDHTSYTSLPGQIYKVSGKETTSFDGALKAYHERVKKIGGRIGFGFSSEGLELEVYEDHFLKHNIFDLYDYELSFSELKEKVSKIISSESHEVSGINKKHSEGVRYD